MTLRGRLRRLDDRADAFTTRAVGVGLVEGGTSVKRRSALWFIGLAFWLGVFALAFVLSGHGSAVAWLIGPAVGLTLAYLAWLVLFARRRSRS